MNLRDIGTDELIDFSQKSISKVNSDLVALLTATGKIELFFRNLLALELIDQLELPENQDVIREWRRHDLVLLEDKKPLHMIEGKAWIHADAINPSKLSKEGAVIRQGLEDDIKKLRETNKEFPSAHKTVSIVLSSVDVTDCDPRIMKMIGYSDAHDKAIKSSGSFEQLSDLGRTKLTEFLRDQPHLHSIKRAPLFEGKFRGMDVYVEGYFAGVE